MEELIDEDLARVRLRDADALLDDVGAELLHGERADIARELADDAVAEAVVVQVEDVLNDLPDTVSRCAFSVYASKTYVVAVRVLHEREGIVRNLLDQLDTLAIRRVINATLEHAASVTVSRDLDAVLRDRVVDKLNMARSG